MMQFTIDREPLLLALTQITGAVSTRSNIAVLSNILVRVQDDRLDLVVTDLDIEASTSLPLVLSTAGSVTAPARELFDIAKRSPSGSEIMISFDPASDNRLKIKAGKSSFALPTLPAGDFPTMDGVSDGVTYSILRSELARMIDKTRHAISSNETRYALTGAHLHIIEEDGTSFLRMVATDARRLALAETPAPDGAVGATPITIPRKALALTRQIIDAEGEPVEITVSEAKFSIRCGQTKLTSKVIDMSFPDYGRVIPRGDGSIIAYIKAADLARGLDTASIVSNEKTPSLKFDFSTDGLRLAARNDKGGQADTHVDSDHHGSGIVIGLVTRLVHDVASLLGEAKMTCHIWSDSDGVRIEDAADPGSLFVVMPVRI